ncbi:diguanylate cyclase response regulator [Scytonema hofmannii PCC 7110]|uniref:Diguanylate cyclase response regulator n=1 Tax=Scytonema hofmannii PCC 7110 TaxID=128403 RepID=A0A139XAY9_9CYAN|nr:PleD family two-component system response regulator [Scytonema hofmannii]KYC41845.1 diguanylate cyclase response regulator [Scytonema hofmannii PCC 7110]
MRTNSLKDPFLILIVDDDSFIRTQLRLCLEKEGYWVTEAKNGEDAIALCQTLRPDAVLLDAMMTGIDGFECCSQLRTIPHWQHVPILMITGLEDQASVDRAFEAGATDYVNKPIHWAVLRQRVKKALEQSQLHQKLEMANQELQRSATTDELTQVANRRHFEEHLKLVWRSMMRERLPISLILCDIDFFKFYNDTYGHQTGDKCLYKVAQAIRNEAKRSTDLVARYGGEEFAVILPNTSAAGSACVAATICSAIRTLNIPHINSKVSDCVTISAGVSTEIPSAHSSYEELIAMADKSLYQAKADGRNCFRHYNQQFLVIKRSHYFSNNQHSSAK